MSELYALIRLRFGEPADPARAASLEIDWWRAHRKRQYSADPAETGDELVESVTRLYSYLYGQLEAVVSPAAVHRVQAMDLSDRWVREAARRTARCSRWSGPRWSAPTPRCSRPSTTRRPAAEQGQIA